MPLKQICFTPMRLQYFKASARVFVLPYETGLYRLSQISEKRKQKFEFLVLHVRAFRTQRNSEFSAISPSVRANNFFPSLTGTHKHTPESKRT
jgi:hypothetical protein